MINMEKKEYKEPTCMVVELENETFLADSGEDENPDYMHGNYRD